MATDDEISETAFRKLGRPGAVWFRKLIEAATGEWWRTGGGAAQARGEKRLRGAGLPVGWCLVRYEQFWWFLWQRFRIWRTL
jgi:hypothetical protein